MNSEHPLEFSSPMDAIVPALFAFHEKVGPLIKNSDNEYFHSKYADLASVLEVVKPPLRDSDLLLVQGASTNGGESVNVETTIFHVASLQWVRTVLTLKPEKPTPQGCGSAITYARRYGLLAMCGIAAEDDDGNSASGRSKEQSPPEPKPTQRDYKLNSAPAAAGPSGLGETQIEGTIGEVETSQDSKAWFVQVGKVNTWTRDKELSLALIADHGREVVAHGRMKPGGKAYQIISYVPKD